MYVRFQAIIKAASNSNTQMDKTRTDHLNQKKSSFKTSNDGNWVNEEPEEKYNHRLMDNTSHYNSHVEHSKRTSGLSRSSNMMENDSENNFDDASSCASDSAIG